MGDPSELNCPYCEKKYNNRGFPPKHIKQHHENSYLLDNNMSVLRSAALDESRIEAEFDNHENPFWDDQGPYPPPPPTVSSTPSPPAKVPLCQNANDYIIKRGKTLPASFLTALLPPPGFLNSLNESLQSSTSPDPDIQQLPASPRLEPLQLPSRRMEPLQLPASPQLDELEVITQWAEANVLTADVSTLSPPATLPDESLLSSASQQLPDPTANTPAGIG